jgi:hypothetical protein
MKKGLFLIAITVVAFVGLGSCASTDPNAPPPYQFDGTQWTKTEDYELTFSGSKWEVVCGTQIIANGDGMSFWTVDGDTLTGNDGGWNGWGHVAGTWALKSGTPGTDTLDGTVWTRTAVLELSFSNGKMYAKDGTHVTNGSKDGDTYTNRPKIEFYWGKQVSFREKRSEPNSDFIKKLEIL